MNRQGPIGLGSLSVVIDLVNFAVLLFQFALAQSSVVSAATGKWKVEKKTPLAGFQLISA
jgi:hypothetical protein